MNNIKKIIMLSFFLILLISCKREEEVKPSEKEIIEVEEKPNEKEINIGTNTFASKIVTENFSREDDLIFNKEDISFDKIKDGKFDIAIIPAYLASNLYEESNEAFKIAAITLTDNLYMLSDTKINNEMDYRGKNLYIPDIYGNLSKIVDKKIGALNLIMGFNVEYFKNMNDVLSKMENSDNFVGLLSEPYYTKALNNKELYVSDLRDLLSIGDSEFLSEVLIVNNNYIANNKNDLDKFLDEYKKESNQIKENVEIPSDIETTYDISEKEAKDIIDKMNFTYIDGDTMKATFSVFMDRLEGFDKDILGKTKPNDDIYYIK